MEPDPFDIAITLYRNTGYSMPVDLPDAKGSPLPTPGYVFHLEISPATFDGSWASPPTFAQQNISGSGEYGTVFVLHEADTAALDFRTSYRYQVLARAPGIGADAVSLRGGSCRVIDGPVMPQVSPL